jgi:hypothetical protein
MQLSGKPMIYSEGAHVRVTDERREDGSNHPFIGKTGIITELLGVRLTGPNWPPRAMAMVRWDDQSSISCVSLENLQLDGGQ